MACEAEVWRRVFCACGGEVLGGECQRLAEAEDVVTEHGARVLHPTGQGGERDE